MEFMFVLLNKFSFIYSYLIHRVNGYRIDSWTQKFFLLDSWIMLGLVLIDQNHMYVLLTLEYMFILFIGFSNLFYWHMD